MAKVNLRGKYSEFEPYLDDIIFTLKEKGAEAAKNKDPDNAVKYQEQVWTLKDFKAGHLQNINPKILDEVFASFAELMKSRETNDNDKRLKALIKKREQIKKLIERQGKGEKLEKNQIDKINSIPELDEEITRLQNIKV